MLNGQRLHQEPFQMPELISKIFSSINYILPPGPLRSQRFHSVRFEVPQGTPTGSSWYSGFRPVFEQLSTLIPMLQSSLRHLAVPENPGRESNSYYLVITITYQDCAQIVQDAKLAENASHL